MDIPLCEIETAAIASGVRFFYRSFSLHAHKHTRTHTHTHTNKHTHKLSYLILEMVLWGARLAFSVVGVAAVDIPLCEIEASAVASGVSPSYFTLSLVWMCTENMEGR